MGHRNRCHESDTSYLRSCPWHSSFAFSVLIKENKLWVHISFQNLDVCTFHTNTSFIGVPHLHFYTLKEILFHPYIPIYPSFQQLFLLCCPCFEFSSFLQILFNTHKTCISKIKSASSFSYHWPCSCYKCQNIQVHSSLNSPSPKP